MKLWHDDVRPPPDNSWAWAHTNREAITILKTCSPRECSLDHDLGARPEDGILARGSSPDGSGLDLVKWMVENDCVPDVVNIHSWSEPGSRRMANYLIDHGYACTLRPYKL